MFTEYRMEEAIPVAYSQRGCSYHHDEHGPKKAVLPRGHGVGFTLRADAVYTLSNPCLLTFVPPTAHLPFGRGISHSSDKCKQKENRSRPQMIRTSLFSQYCFCFSVALVFFCDSSRGADGLFGWMVMSP